MVFLLLKFAYFDFLEDRKFNNVTTKTIENYEDLLGKFIEYCNNNEVINVQDITHLHIKQYLIECQKRGNKPLTINSILQRIRTFLNYMVECEIIKKNPALRISRQRDDVQIEVFSDEQIRQMLNYYRRIKQRDKSYCAYRNYMIIITLLSTGIRRGEAINVKWDDIDLINRNMKVIGKNRIKETIPITEKLTKELSAYQSYCMNYFKYKDKLNEYLFTNNRGTDGMTLNSFSQIFKYLQQVMNFENVRVSAHTFRHTFCHRLAISGMSVFAIQKLMRHKSINQTMKYVAMWGDELKGENDKFNPINKIDL